MLEYASPTAIETIARLLGESGELQHVSVDSIIRPANTTCANTSGMQIWANADFKSWAAEAVKQSNAHKLQKGHAYVSVIDTGIDVDHPSHRAFAGNPLVYEGGNFHPNLSYDAGKTGVNPYSIAYVAHEVDEYRVITHQNDAFHCDETSNNGDANGYQEIKWTGHGTHVAGIVAARKVGGFSGVCPHCPMSVARVINVGSCAPPNSKHADTNERFETHSEYHYHRIAAGLVIAANIGVQVANISFAGILNGIEDMDRCLNSWPNEPICLAIALAEELDVIVAAASGNDNKADEIAFPASDPRVWGVGGVMKNTNPSISTPLFWQDGGPPYCGSNYANSYNGYTETVDFVAPAAAVFSTMPEAGQWSPSVCHEWNDSDESGSESFGYCSGTSMATPFVSGVAALVRSTAPTAGKADVHAAIAATAVSGDPDQFGNGIPQADAAVKDMLGRVNNVQITNRATPLFSLKGENSEDYLHTTKPQVAVAFLRHPNWGYVSDSASPDVAYYEFNLLGNMEAVVPKADVYIMTTHQNPYASEWIKNAELKPLYRMRYIGAHGSNSLNVDVALVEQSRILDFKGVGYEMEGLEGYIYHPCTPEPACMPPGAVKLWRGYNSSKDDHAVFPQSRYSSMTGAGYSVQLTMLGYAYPNYDSDSDGLIDAWELQIGTNPYFPDTDCDGVNDGVEYPPFGRPVSDPVLPNQC